jgi:hypothetical protein
MVNLYAPDCLIDELSSQGHLRFVFISPKLNLIAVFWFYSVSENG